MTHPTNPHAPVIRCRRVDALFTVAEHQACPYCFGATAAVASGDYARFCTFRPGADPVCFGFPDPVLDAAPPPAVPTTPAPVVVPCHRVEAAFDVEGHRDCPYCSGRAEDVATGDHAKFCTFVPGQDPIAFGFPPDFGRQNRT